MNQENPLPVRYGNDHSADDRPKPQANAEDNPPYSKGFDALLTFLKLMGEHSHLTNQHRAATHSLKKPADNQNGNTLG